MYLYFNTLETKKHIELNNNYNRDHGDENVYETHTI